MFESTNFMKTQYLLERGLDASVLRRDVIADNIANVDVPHFKRSEVTFEANLKRALESEKIMEEKAIPTKISDDRHISFFTPLDYKEVDPQVKLDYLTTMRPDGSNVDIEKEVVDATEAQMQYMMMVERINQNYRELRSVMRMA